MEFDVFFETNCHTIVVRYELFIVGFQSTDSQMRIPGTVPGPWIEASPCLLAWTAVRPWWNPDQSYWCHDQISTERNEIIGHVDYWIKHREGHSKRMRSLDILGLEIVSVFSALDITTQHVSPLQGGGWIGKERGERAQKPCDMCTSRTRLLTKGVADN